MKKNTRNLLLIIGLIVILAVAVLVLTLSGGEEEENSSSLVSAETISLISQKEENLSSVKVTNENGTYTIHVTEEVKESTSSSSDASSEEEPETEFVYSMDGVDAAVANTDRMETAGAIGISLNATQNLGKKDNLDDFGLADPVSTVEVTYKDGSTETIYIGIAVSGGTGYYVMVDGDENVYTAACNEGLFQSSSYYVKTTKIELEADESTGLVYATSIKLSGTEMPEPIEIEGGDDYVYRLVSPKKAEADSEEVQAIIDGLATISATNVASPDTSEESLKKHGLDEPAGVIEFSIKGQEGSYKLSVSAKNEDGTRYALLDGTKAIFIINDSDVSAWLGRSVLSLQSTLNLMPQIETIKTMTITVDGEEYSFRLEREEDPESSTEDKTAYTYKVFNKDGKELDYEENFKHFYRSFITNYIIEDAREIPEGDPYVTCTYTYFDSDETNSIAFYKASDRRYCVVEDGDNVKGLIAPNDLERAVEYLELLNNGEEVPEIY